MKWPWRSEAATAVRSPRETRRFPVRVAEQLCADPSYRSELERLAREEQRGIEEQWTEARGYMREMISIPDAFWLALNSRFNDFVLGLGYEKTVVCEASDLARLGEILRAHPALLLWTHKTYLDGMVVPKVLYDAGLTLPHLFGGANMSFAGLGMLVRRGGGIFIRRSFQDNALYKLTLRSYIAHLIGQRFPLSWSFEGTRSRLGKLMPPRYGLLKYVLEACHCSGAEGIHIVPVSISYDLIRDVEEYASEQVGRVKGAESLRWFLAYLSSLRKPMGRIYMNVGEPIVLDRAPDPEDRLALQKIAFQVAVGANTVTPLTVPSLLTMVLLGAAPQALTSRELRREVREIWQWAVARGIRISSDFDPGQVAHVEGLLEIMNAEGVVSRYDEGPDVVWGIALEQHPVASYYRNTTIHFFVNKAIVELALLEAAEAPGNGAESAFWGSAERLRDLFKFEFFYAPSEGFRRELQEELQRVAPDWQLRLARGELAAASLQREFRPLVAHATLLTYVEAYGVVADLLARLPPEQGLDEAECVARALKYGRQAYLQRRVSSLASIGKILFANAHRQMAHRGLTAPGDAELSNRRRELAQYLRQLARRLESLRAVVAEARGRG